MGCGQQQNRALVLLHNVLSAVKTKLVKPIERENTSVYLLTTAITHHKIKKCASNFDSSFRMIKRCDVPNRVQIMITMLSRHCSFLLNRQHLHRAPLIRTLVIRMANYPDRPGRSGKFVENSTKLTCLEISVYRFKYNTVLWHLELQIRRGRQVQTQVHTVNSNSRTSNCQCSLFSNKNPIIRIFCMSGWLAVPINPDKRSSTVLSSLLKTPQIYSMNIQ